MNLRSQQELHSRMNIVNVVKRQLIVVLVLGFTIWTLPTTGVVSTIRKAKAALLQMPL